MRILESSGINRNLRVVVVAGGVGGARMARAMAAVIAPENLTIVVNVGDDDRIYGALVCPDLDTVTYTLAGCEGPEGWGLAADTFSVMGHLAEHDVDTTFRLGDRDLAHCLARTMFLDGGGTLSEFTARTASRWGVPGSLIPASDDPIRTKIVTPDGVRLDFQDYFVRRRQRDTVAGLEFVGAEGARAAPGVVAAIAAADAVVLAPSNPPLSLWPIFAVVEIAAATAAHDRVIAVSPLIGGRAVKGPLVSVMTGLGLEPDQPGILQTYRGLVTHMIIDHTDSAMAAALEESGVGVTVTNTLITEPEAGAKLGEVVASLARTPRRPSD